MGNALNYLKNNEEIVHLLRQAGTEGMLLIEAFSKACIQDMITRLEGWQEDLEDLPDVPLSLLAEFYIGGLVAAVQWWIAQDQPCTEEEMTRCIRSIVQLRKIPSSSQEK